MTMERESHHTVEGARRWLDKKMREAVRKVLESSFASADVHALDVMEAFQKDWNINAAEYSELEQEESYKKHVKPELEGPRKSISSMVEVEGQSEGETREIDVQSVLLMVLRAEPDWIKCTTLYKIMTDIDKADGTPITKAEVRKALNEVLEQKQIVQEGKKRGAMYKIAE